MCFVLHGQWTTFCCCVPCLQPGYLLAWWRVLMVVGLTFFGFAGSGFCSGGMIESYLAFTLPLTNSNCDISCGVWLLNLLFGTLLLLCLILQQPFHRRLGSLTQGEAGSLVGIVCSVLLFIFLDPSSFSPHQYGLCQIPKQDRQSTFLHLPPLVAFPTVPKPAPCTMWITCQLPKSCETTFSMRKPVAGSSITWKFLATRVHC